MYKTISTGIIVFLVLSFTVLAGCVTTGKDNPTPSTDKEIKIAAGTSEQIGKLVIAVSDTRKEYYQFADGRIVESMKAELNIQLAGNPPVEKRMSVSYGQKVEFEGYILFVKEISLDSDGGSVTLLVQEPRDLGTPAEQQVVWDVYKGTAKVMIIKNEPGSITSNYYLGEPPSSPYLSAKMLYEVEEPILKDILKKSHSFDEFVSMLKSAGYILKPGKW